MTPHREQNQPQIPMRIPIASTIFHLYQCAPNRTPHQLCNSTHAVERANSPTQLPRRRKLCNDGRQHGNEDAGAKAVQRDEGDEDRDGAGYRPGAETEEAAEDGHGVDGVGGAGDVGGEAASAGGVSTDKNGGEWGGKQ
jgi:hypothetical protein